MMRTAAATQRRNGIPRQDGEFYWTPNMQGLVIGSFYYGYATSQIIGGRLAEIFGGKRVFGIAILLSGILNLVTPVAARFNVILLVAIRILEGVLQGMTLPAMHSMLGRWVPDSEKSVLVNAVHNGINVGTIVSMPITGWLCASGFLGGWPSAFYVFGIFGIAWCILWHFTVTDYPVDHPWIRATELDYIIKNQNIQTSKKLPPVPWSSILKSVPFWALVSTEFSQNFNFYILLNDLPTFMATILHFKVDKDGALSALPLVAELIVRTIVGICSDIALRRNWCSVDTARKLCNTVASVSVAIGMIVIIFIGCNVNWTITVFVLANGISGFSGSGYVINHLDLSPEYAGTLMGLAGTIANLTGFLAPAVVGALTEHSQTRHQWSVVFIITIVLLVVSGAIFHIFGSAKKQEWSKEKQQKS